MSGIPCIVVASGNRTQAFALSFKDATPGRILPHANTAIGLAQTLCTFAGTYDPVATADQQERATKIMGDFCDAAAAIDTTRPFNAREVNTATVMLGIFNRAAQFLVDEILANP